MDSNRGGISKKIGNSDESEASAIDSAERERLLSLPYEGYVEEAETEAVEGDGVVKRDAARSQLGYNLYTVLHQSIARLVDEEGRVVREWSTNPSRAWNHVRLTPEGDLLVCGANRFRSSPMAMNEAENYLARLSFDGELAWRVNINVHHDVLSLKTGRVMSMSFRDRRIESVYADGPVRDDEIVVLDGDGSLIERASLYDIVIQKPEIMPLLPSNRPGADIFHANSIHRIDRPEFVGQHPIYERGNILISSRNQDRIFVINWPRKELIWSWGLGTVSGQHDAQVLDNGNILLFDNGVVRKWSRVIELDPRKNEIVWEYRGERKEDFYSLSRGSAQRLSNGNTLIAVSDRGEAIEVTREGETVWRYLCPRDGKGKRPTIVRMVRLDRGVIDGLLVKSRAGSQSAAEP